MTAPSELELQGSFLTHPFAELLAETAQARLTGSLRVSNGDRKCVIYVNRGKVVFAVSNARSSRIFDMLLRRNRLTKEDVTKIPNFANDLELTGYLEKTGFLTKEQRDQLFVEQIKSILIDILGWPSGDWTFTSLARLRDGLRFDVAVDRILVDYSRCLSVEAVLLRFRSLNETFTRIEGRTADFLMNPGEHVVLKAISHEPRSAANLVSYLKIGEATAIQSLYTLWLGGLLVREEWNPAFTHIKIAAILDAKLELKQEAKLTDSFRPAAEPNSRSKDAIPTHSSHVPAVEVQVTLEEYLQRVKHAQTHYDILGVEPTADAAVIKRAYFGLAKTFHPDHYHKDGGELLQRVQNAFTELTHAHETLKAPEMRETYDFKIRKEIADREKLRSAGSHDELSQQLRQAADSFERGFGFLMEDETEAAVPFLARAAHFAPKNAKYHAYYGRALAADGKNRHKAESEMQTAIRLDANNPTYRIILAEFFIQQNLLKRAEGELNRLLAIFPSNREASTLLDSIQK